MSPLTIPTWEQADLGQLGAAGELSGVSPQILAAIDQAESSGQGGGINTSGYGGFFGLGAGQSYPAGTPSSALLSDPSQQSFDSQAVLASSEFASLLQRTGGDVYAAESAYQGGSSEGTSVFASLGVPTTNTPNASTAGVSWNPATGFLPTILGGVGSSVTGSITSFISKALIVVAGLAVAVFGITRLTKPTMDQTAEKAAPLAAVAA